MDNAPRPDGELPTPPSLYCLAALKVCQSVNDYDEIVRLPAPQSVVKFLRGFWGKYYDAYIEGNHVYWPSAWIWESNNGFCKRHYFREGKTKFTEMDKLHAMQDFMAYAGEFHKTRITLRCQNPDGTFKLMRLCEVCIERSNTVENAVRVEIIRDHSVASGSMVVHDFFNDMSNFCERCHQRLVAHIMSAGTCVRKIGLAEHRCDCLNYSDWVQDNCSFCWDGFGRNFTHYKEW